ncbi:hypothetical protein DM02DRAFT_616320 [Periconia macrospinosa]|uniref:FHA domain-containing protein n=1 Tax=Periconia macrospinosa TaxID=97972 RepID=A0A2V1DIJ5_9PLEO|nr:hypothetical protein DM02DRAFT_616320 [Periconia macrospinosa]
MNRPQQSRPPSAHPDNAAPWKKDMPARRQANSLSPPRKARKMSKSTSPVPTRPRETVEKEQPQDSPKSRKSENFGAASTSAPPDRDLSPEPYRKPRDRTEEKRRDPSRDRRRDRSTDRRRERSRERRRHPSSERKRDRSEDNRRRDRSRDKDRRRDRSIENKRDRSRDRRRDRSREKKRERSREGTHDRKRDRSREDHRHSRRDRSRDRRRHRSRSNGRSYRDRNDRDHDRRRRNRSSSSSRSPSPPRKRNKRTRSPSPHRRAKAPLPSQELSFRGTDNSKVAPSKYGGAPPTLEKPNFKPTGLLAKAANKVDGTKISLKYHEPPEARKPSPSSGWRIFVFKGEDVLDTIELHTRSCWLFGRSHEVVDYVLEHPSSSGQHAVIQFRNIVKTTEDEFGVKKQHAKVKPYIIDLESSNGTELNGKRIETSRYFELRHKDILTFAGSEREYVVMLPPPEEKKEEGA